MTAEGHLLFSIACAVFAINVYPNKSCSKYEASNDSYFFERLQEKM